MSSTVSQTSDHLLQGPKGEFGVTGPLGPPGPPGFRGPIGMQGEAGLFGPQVYSKVIFSCVIQNAKTRHPVPGVNKLCVWFGECHWLLLFVLTSSCRVFVVLPVSLVGPGHKVGREL